ncbi:MAG: hypothetical protein ACKOPE_04890 [Novosphingobium sp.]
MDPFASKLGFTAAAAAAAVLGALFPRPSYEVVDYTRSSALAARAQAWQPVSGMEDRYSYSGALPANKGPIDVYGLHPWRSAREKEILARQEAQYAAALAYAEGPQVARAEPVAEAPVAAEAAPQPVEAVVIVHRGAADEGQAVAVALAD